ncbi:MAG: VanZ family protein, partial [Vicinamibacterales bacterium]
MGLLRARIRSAFPRDFVWIIGGAVAATIVVAIGAALVRMRDRRLPRIAAIGGALALGGAYAVIFASGRADVDVVERFHFIEYGLIALLFYRVWENAGDSSTIVRPLLAALMVATCDEWVQWFIPVRVGELADIALDVVAAACGVLFSIALS